MKRTLVLIAAISWLAACGRSGPISTTGGPLPAAPTSAPAERELQPLAVAQAPTRTVVAYYRPTPPFTAHVGTHIVDGWITNMYYGTAFKQDEERLQIGGWGDNYRTYIQFDTKGLPQSANDATLNLWAYSRGDKSTLVNFDVWAPTSAWVNAAPGDSHYLSTSMHWKDQPGFKFVGGNPARPIDGFWPIPITGLYNSWQTGPNNGLALMSWTQNNNFDVWRSSRYAVYEQRPMLRLTFQSSAPDFKMPLPRNVAWQVTTELGGWDCIAKYYDKAHDLDNYMSVDFSWNNKDANGNQVYRDPANGAKIPILAAAGGVVRTANFDGLNGNHVAISHDVGTQLSHGYSSRYLHMLAPLAVRVGDVVHQGDILGYMGNTGQSDGAHLHFGLRYDDHGDPVKEPMLTYATVGGWLMKSFQSECVNGQRIRYYMSS